MSILSLLFFLNLVSGRKENVVSPGCNYAATDFHFYPIGACEREKVDSTYSAFKYVCYGDNEVYKLQYDGPNYCDGSIVSSTKVTDTLRGYECDSTVCSYSDSCRITGCSNDCSDCENNPHNFNQHCLPWITDHCTGNVGELLIQDTCSFGVNEQNYYFGTDDCNDESAFTITTTHNSCQWNAYHTVSCQTEVLTPQCNYAATDFRFYPIGGCVKDRIVNSDGNRDYYAFEYICDGEDIYKNEYDDDTYCNGVPITSVRQNDVLRHFECDLKKCEFAEICYLYVCDDECSDCLSNENDFSSECLPIIYDECLGHKGELLENFECDGRNDPNINDLLTENLYWGGDQCVVDYFLFSIMHGGDVSNSCFFNELTTVDCKPRRVNQGNP